MSTLTDTEITTLQRSFDFYLNPNYAINAAESATSPPQLTARHEVATYDDFIRVVPFEAFARDPLAGVRPSRPNSSEPTVAYAPGYDSLTDDVPLGADWFPQNSALPLTNLAIETTVDGDYETFFFFRMGSSIGIDQMQEKLIKQQAGDTTGPDPVPTIIRTASTMLVRQLSREALNNTDEGSASDPKGNTVPFKMVGLAKYYDNGFGGGSDPQVIKSAGTTTLAEVRRIMRRVCPSHDGFGMGPDALVMSRRCRDLLISLERADNTPPTFMADPRNGERRYHFDGVPVYVGLVREDEDNSGGSPAFQSSGPYTYNTTSIYALRLGGPTGARILHMGGASQNYGVQVNRVPTGTSGEEGFRVEGYYTWFIPERQSVARLWGIDISGEAA